MRGKEEGGRQVRETLTSEKAGDISVGILGAETCAGRQRINLTIDELFVPSAPPPPPPPPPQFRD